MTDTPKHLPKQRVDPRLRLLFIHIRGHASLAQHERTCLLEVLNADPDQATSINIVETPDLPFTTIKQHDAVILGGSGDHSVVDQHPFSDHLAKLVKQTIDQRIPLFGSCWGHQFIAKALGGEVIRDLSRKEVGAIDINNAAHDTDDPIFSEMPRAYTVLMGHEDRVSKLPPGATSLAESRACSNQAFRIDGLAVYGTQFHAELTPERLIERLAAYRHYMPDDHEFAALRDSLRPTPEAETIIANFLKHFT